MDWRVGHEMRNEDEPELVSMSNWRIMALPSNEVAESVGEV